jgi:hypothetical protein
MRGRRDTAPLDDSGDSKDLPEGQEQIIRMLDILRALLSAHSREVNS